MESPISITNLGVVISLLALILYAIRLWLLPKPIPGIPYNPISTSRLLGDAPDLFAWKATRGNGDMFAYIPHLAYKLNTPIFQMFVRPLGKPWVVVTDYREAHDILTRRFKEFDRSDFFGDVFKPALPEFHVHMPTGEKWHEHRRLVGETMSPWFLNGVAGPLMWSTSLHLVELWREKARLAQGRPFTAAQDVYKGALDIIWAAAFGEETGSNRAQAGHLKNVQDVRRRGAGGDDELVVFPETRDPPDFESILTLTESMDIAVESIIPRWHYWFALTFYPRFVAAKKHRDQMIRTKLEQAKARFSSKSMEDVELMSKSRSALDLVVTREIKAAEKQGRSPNYDSQGIQDELFGFLMAGHETTSTSICWTLKLLTKHQAVQTKFRTALHAHFPQALTETRPPSIDEIASSHIPYFEALIEEVGRYGLTAIGTIRKTLTDTVILGCHVPKNTDVFMMSNGPGYLTRPLDIDESKRSKSSRDAKAKTPSWREDGIAEFDVERWLVEDETGEVRFNANAGPNLPFGAGPRACFGRKWALLEMKILLVLIFWNFELLPLPAGLVDDRSVNGVTHRPENVYLRLKALS